MISISIRAILVNSLRKNDATGIVKFGMPYANTHVMTEYVILNCIISENYLRQFSFSLNVIFFKIF